MRPKLALLLIVALVGCFVANYLIRRADAEHGTRQPPAAAKSITAGNLTEIDKSKDSSLPPGMKAVALKVNAEPQSSAFVLPHSHVDIISVVPQSDGTTHSETILRNILLLAPNGSEQADTVTVLVTPEQFERLAVAQKMGTINVVPRPLVYPEIDP